METVLANKVISNGDKWNMRCQLPSFHPMPANIAPAPVEHPEPPTPGERNQTKLTSDSGCEGTHLKTIHIQESWEMWIEVIYPHTSIFWKHCISEANVVYFSHTHFPFQYSILESSFVRSLSVSLTPYLFSGVGESHAQHWPKQISSPMEDEWTFCRFVFFWFDIIWF